jgi:phosphoribosylaminoimidazole carboxylase (NCAIR synthetase)
MIKTRSYLQELSAEQVKEEIIVAGYKAVEELLKIAEEAVITNDEDDVSADRLKNAAATKKLAIFDAFELLSRIEEEKSNILASTGQTNSKTEVGFAEQRTRGNR